MKIPNFKIAIASVMLLIPMSYLHLGDGHHTGYPHSSVHQPSYQYSIRELETGLVMGQGWMTTHRGGGPEVSQI